MPLFYPTGTEKLARGNLRRQRLLSDVLAVHAVGGARGSRMLSALLRPQASTIRMPPSA
jgi:hypothetical protein